ncbi:hypothetical protein EB008_05560, partial [bacterium]|nr:hypothetical protein [bacterium]
MKLEEFYKKSSSKLLNFLEKCSKSEIKINLENSLMFHPRDLPTPAQVQKLYPLSLETRKKVLDSRRKFQ